jgi:MFS family permease
MANFIGADNRFGKDFGHPGPNMQGNIVALYDIGCVIGAITTYIVGERLGRRTMLILGGSIMILGTATLASSFSVAQLIVECIVTGIGN